MSTTMKIRLLRAFAASPKPLNELDAIAKQHRMTPDAVRDLVVGHGWPDPDAMDHAADILARRPPDPPSTSTPRLAAQPPPQPTASRPPDPAGTAAVVGLDNLLHKGDQSSSARTRGLAKRVRDLAGELQRRVTEEANADRLAAAERAQKEKLAKEVAELELELAQKKAALRGTPIRAPRTSSTPTTGPSAKAIRAWAEANGIECNDRGRVPADVRARYDAAHQQGAA